MKECVRDFNRANPIPPILMASRLCTGLRIWTVNALYQLLIASGRLLSNLPPTARRNAPLVAAAKTLFVLARKLLLLLAALIRKAQPRRSGNWV